MVIKTTHNNNTQLIIQKLAESLERLHFFKEEHHQKSLDSIKQLILFREKLRDQTQGQRVLLQKDNATVQAPIQSAMALLRDGLAKNLHGYCSVMTQLRPLAWNNDFSGLFKKELTDEVLEGLILSEDDKSFYTTIALCFYHSVSVYLLNDSSSFGERFDEFLLSIGVYDDTILDNSNALELKDYYTFELKEYSIKELIEESLLEELIEELGYSTDTINKTTVSLPRDLEKFAKLFINYSPALKKRCLQGLYGDTLQFNELMIILLVLDKARYVTASSITSLLNVSRLSAISLLESVNSKVLAFNDNPTIETLVNNLVFFKSYTIDQVLFMNEALKGERNKEKPTNKNVEEFIIMLTIITLINNSHKFDSKKLDLIKLNLYYNSFFWFKLYPLLSEKNSVVLKELNPCLDNLMDYSIKNDELTIHKLYDNDALVRDYGYDEEKLKFFCMSIQKQYPFIKRVILDKKRSWSYGVNKNGFNKDFAYKYLLIHRLKSYYGAEDNAVRLLYTNVKDDLLNYKAFQLLLKPDDRAYVRDSIKVLKRNLDELEGVLLGLSMINFDYTPVHNTKVEYYQLKQEVVELLSEY